MNVFRISPIIRITLFCLYIALTVPLPFLADFTHAPVPSYILWIGILLGAIALFAALSEQVILDDHQIKVAYPNWIPRFFRQGWSLSWSEIDNLKMRTTGQGGLVYYFTSSKAEKAYLLPMRVAGFNKMVNIVTEKTGIDTVDVRPLAQPWMYLILFVFTMFLWLIDGWTIWTATHLTV
ncbi:hypothetical protein NIES4102_12990 [Chondrocystis sp. NIES-4102]|nr:hypothetical protein NIES4102_12990 [Chondrocystis sp. NIES-4102]